MKIFIILALVALAAAEWNPKNKNQLKQMRLGCMRIQNMSQDLKVKVNQLEYPDNDQTKEFILCSARGSQLWDDTDGWLPDRIVQILIRNQVIFKEEEIRSIIVDCLDDNAAGNKIKDWAFRTYKCMIESNMKETIRSMINKLV